MKLLITLLFFIQIGYSQNTCDCKQVVAFVQNQIEQNSASYQHQVIEYKRESAYKTHKKQVNKIAKSLKTQKECVGLVSFYLSFLRDSHQWISVTNDYYPFSTFEDSVSVRKFLSENVENIPLKKLKKNQNQIEGDWIYRNGLFEMTVQPNTKKGRKYVGIQTTSLKYYVIKGDIRIDFYSNYNNDLYGVFWDFGQKPKTYPVNLENGKLKIGRTYYFVRNKKDIIEEIKSQIKKETFFEELSSKTNYLRVHSFLYENKKNIDSVINVSHDKLLEKDNLIIDIRDNGGGNDLSYFPLLSYILENKKYKHPFEVNTFISKDNFAYFESIKYKYGVETKQDSLDADNEIAELKKHLGKFTPNRSHTNVIDTVYSGKIRNVYIITDREVASSAESFIKTAQLSSKNVKIIGENTAGVLQYGEWRRVDIPNFPAWISITEKKWEYSGGVDLEMIGIQPDIFISENEKDWVKITLQEIEKIE
jgi:hypothetical protein